MILSYVFQKDRKKHNASFFSYLCQTRTLFVLFLAVFILIISAIISFIFAHRSNFLPYLQNIEVLSFNDGLHVAINEKVLNGALPGEKCTKLSASLDGRIAAFLTDKKELYLVRDDELRKIAEDVLHFEISAFGQGIAFAQKYAMHNSLTLYNPDEETLREITTTLSRLDFSLSPDGKTVAYYDQSSGIEALMCHRNSHSMEITSSEADLVGLSNDGKYIYAVYPIAEETFCLYAFNLKGKSTELGQVTSISFKFNHDHRQIMFYNNGQTMVSINGRPGAKISSYPLYLVTAPNSQSTSDGNSITLPVTTLFNHVYTCSDGESTSAWYICKDPKKSEKLISRVSGCMLDASAEYLYFIHDHCNLCVMNVTNGISKITVLAENADSYVVAPSRKFVYFTYNGALYSANGKKSGEPRLIASDYSGYNLVMGASNTIYYLIDNNIFACRNGKKADLIVENINSIYNSSNNVVYLLGDETIYIANSKKQPIKVLGND